MTQQPIEAIYCDNIGNTTQDLHCCYPNNQAAPICRKNFDLNGPTFRGGSGDWITDCQDPTLLYSSKIQKDPSHGNGEVPIQRYLTCANVPSMVGYLSQDLLEPNIFSSIAPHIPSNTTRDDLSKVTLAVTECLTQTCKHSRKQGRCKGVCSAVNLLTNNTAPNIQGLNGCLNTLCTGGYASLPWADTDVVGIGVFASYIMQCIFVVLLCFGLLAFDVHSWKRRDKVSKQKTEQSETDAKKEKKSHRNIFEEFLVQFHKAQCYFSASIQVAALSYGIFETDMLVTFVLIPIVTNGVLPIVFAFVLLFRCGRSTMDVTLPTVACWILSSIVYWILYSHIIPINSDIRLEERKFQAYKQVMYKLSAIDACGGYSALAVCPSNFELSRKDIFSASRRLSVLTPIIWTFSTVCILAILAVLGPKFTKWCKRRQKDVHEKPDSDIKRPDSNTERPDDNTEKLESSTEKSDSNTQDHPPFLRSSSGSWIIYLLITLCSLAGIGMQLSLLSIALSLQMINRKDWGFGQIVAVTIWAPPLLGYLYEELKKGLKELKKGLTAHKNIDNVPKPNKHDS